MLAIVDMVIQEIRKNTDLEVNAVGPFKLQAQGRNLHNTVLRAGFSHLGKKRLEFPRFRGRVFRLDRFASDLIFHGSDQAAGSSRTL